MRAKTIFVQAYDIMQARSKRDNHITNSPHLRVSTIREPESDMVLGITIDLPESLDKMGLRLPILGDQLERFYALTREMNG
jgi:hypothetical protein